MVKKNKVGIVPLGDRLVIRREGDAGERMLSGIIIPETAHEEKPQIGSVIAVGKGRVNDEGKRIPIEIAVGERVIFSRFGHDEVEIEGEEYLIISENNILAVIQ
ncbi:MAG: co-chaperone GroES [Candidatus Paceibacterota bacterium]